VTAFQSDTGKPATIPPWLLENGISPGALLLYAWLDHEWADKDNLFSFPGVHTIAEEITRARLRNGARGVSPSWVKRHRRELERLGALVVKARYTPGGRQTSNGYYLRRSDPGRVEQRWIGTDADPDLPAASAEHVGAREGFKNEPLPGEVNGPGTVPESGARQEVMPLEPGEGSKNEPLERGAVGEGSKNEPGRGSKIDPSSNEPRTKLTTRPNGLGAAAGADGILQAIYRVWGWKKRASRQAAAADRKAARELAEAGVTPEQAALAAKAMSQDDWWREKGFSVRKLANDWERWSKAGLEKQSILGRDPREDPDVMAQMEGYE